MLPHPWSWSPTWGRRWRENRNSHSFAWNKRHHPLHTIPHVSFIRTQVVVTVSIVGQKKSSLSPQPLILLFTSQALSSERNNTVRVDLKKQDLGSLRLLWSRVKVLWKAKWPPFCISRRSHHCGKTIVDACWCKEPRHHHWTMHGFPWTALWEEAVERTSPIFNQEQRPNMRLIRGFQFSVRFVPLQFDRWLHQTLASEKHQHGTTQDVTIINVPKVCWDSPFSCRVCRESSAPMSFSGLPNWKFSTLCILPCCSPRSLSTSAASCAPTQGQFPAACCSATRSRASADTGSNQTALQGGINVSLLCTTIFCICWTPFCSTWARAVLPPRNCWVLGERELLTFAP